jgi:hypothetical protein
LHEPDVLVAGVRLAEVSPDEQDVLRSLIQQTLAIR